MIIMDDDTTETDDEHSISSEEKNSSSSSDVKRSSELTSNTTAKAVSLVKEIIKQITSNDAPAQNEANPTFPDVNAFKYQPLSTPACHSVVSYNNSTLTSFHNYDGHRNYNTYKLNNSESKLTFQSTKSKGTTGESSSNTAITESAKSGPSENEIENTSPKSQISQLTNLEAVDATKKMGNTALSSLCFWTLDQVKQLQPELGQSEESNDVDLQIDIGALALDTPRNSNHFNTQFKISNLKSLKDQEKNHKRGFLRWTKKSRKSLDGSCPSALAGEEKKEDDASWPTVRLQLFGSEYARHLSKCQLAPSLLPTNSNKEQVSQRFTSLHNSSNNNNNNNNSQRQSRTISRLPPSTIYLEDASPEVKNGALLDILVTENETPPPLGYYRISQTLSGRPFFFAANANTSSKKLGAYYLNVKKEPIWDKAAQRPCITAITVIYADRKEFVPPGFSIVRKLTLDHKNNLLQDGIPADLNQGSVNPKERIFLCFRRSREGNPITGIVPLAPDAQEPVPEGYTVIERTPRNFVASLTSNNNIPPVFLAYRQRLANLETLRPFPLLMAVQEKKYFVQPERNPKYVLNAYYGTGGTTVDSEIGRFHIMDRSTHSLLSPGSVANRLSLIEMSRRKARNQQFDSDLEPSTHYKRSTNESLQSDGDRPDDISLDEAISYGYHTDTASVLTGSVAELSSRAGTYGTDSVGASSCIIGESFSTENANLSSLSILKDGAVEATYIPEDKEDTQRRKRLKAMNFIPIIETAVKGDEAMGRLTMRTAVITPILTACYTRHGGSAMIAVEGLASLLTETDFFKDDVDISDGSDNESSRRLTLLDLAVQAVCDVAISSCQEVMFTSCVSFTERAVSFSQGQLNTRTIGVVIRFYLFVFYFDACIPRLGHSKWPSPSWRPVSMYDEEDFPMLYDLRVEDESITRLPGGAPQAAALALKDLISFSIVRLGKASVTDLIHLRDSKSDAYVTSLEDDEIAKDPYAPFLESIFSSLVNNAIDHVDRANYTQLALHQIHRSGGSELFWHDMVHQCGQGLFGKEKTLREAGRDIFIMIFAMLEQLVKVSSGKLRLSGAQNSLLMPKDIASKLLALELVLHFLEFWSDEQEALAGMSVTREKNNLIPSIHTLAFVVRRTVVPCLLWNTQAGIENPQVFRRLISIVSELWGSTIYRHHCKVELGMLIEHFGIRILELGPQIPSSRNRTRSCLFSQQVELLSEIKTWFSDDPYDVVELFLNYDTDLSCQINNPVQLLPGTRWQLFQRICAGLCSIAEKCGEQIAHQIRENQSLMFSQKEDNVSQPGVSSSKEEAKKNAADLSIIRESTKLIRKTSIEAISQIVHSLAVSAANATHRRYAELLSSWKETETEEPSETKRPTIVTDRDDETEDGDLTAQDPLPQNNNEALKLWRDSINVDKKQQMDHITAPTTKQESLATAFHLARTKSLKKAVEYLIACNVIAQFPREIANFLQIHKNRFNDAELGLYLSEGGIGSSETEYWSSIRYHFVRASSFIGMTVEEGLRAFLTTSGFKLPGEAQRIDRMVNTFSQCYFEDNAGDHTKCPFQDHDTVYLLVFAIIMLNTDLHKSSLPRKNKKKMTKAEFINNLRGAMQGDTVSKEYLSKIYDSIEGEPITMQADSSTKKSLEESHKRTIQDMINSARATDSLLRGLAVHEFQFATIMDFTSITSNNADTALSELTHCCVAKTWHHWHGVVNTCLETAHLDPQGMVPAVIILLYALCATICLNMPVERHAFLSQLVRLKGFEERRQGRWVSAPDNSHREESWYMELEEACDGAVDRKLWAMRTIYKWIKSLQVAFESDVPNKVGMASAVAEIVNGNFLLQDPTRSYLRSGNLIKKSGRTGRQAEYRFYLFSDVLLYAGKQSDGHYKIHEELPLHLMKIVDWFPPSQINNNTIFEVHHPRKTFQVVCASVQERKSWVNDIRMAIKEDMERKMKVEAARLAVHHARRFSPN